MNEQPLYMVKLSFNAGGEKAGKISSMEWLFKTACRRALSKSKELRDIPPPSKIAWIKIFKNHTYEIITNKRYSYGAIYLVYGMGRVS